MILKIEFALFLFIGCAILGAILVLFFKKDIIIIATSIRGAFVLMDGIDAFAQQGFSTIISYEHTKTNLLSVWMMTISAIILSLIFMTFQYKTCKK